MHKLSILPCVAAMLLVGCGGRVSDSSELEVEGARIGGSSSDRGEEADRSPGDGLRDESRPHDSKRKDESHRHGRSPKGSKQAKGWKNHCFTTWDAPSCSGARYVRYDHTYDKYVGVILCSAAQYKIYLADSPDDPFYQIGDYAGHGQDHCELINPDFRIPNEDDMHSGGCAVCATSADTSWYENPVGTRGYSRAQFGETFTIEPLWPAFNLYTVAWYACGVSFPIEGSTCPNDTWARPKP